jgi:hypothetical protein
MWLLQPDSHRKEEAMTSLQMSVDIAKQQKALLFQLRAAMSMAEAAISIDQPERGLRPLRHLCANLPEGFEALELADSKRLSLRST